MCALLGLGDLHTNVNLPNKGQIPNLPLGAVVETNASFTSNTVPPDLADPIPETIYSMISRICGEQELIVEAAAKQDLNEPLPVKLTGKK